MGLFAGKADFNFHGDVEPVRVWNQASNALLRVVEESWNASSPLDWIMGCKDPAAARGLFNQSQSSHCAASPSGDDGWTEGQRP